MAEATKTYTGSCHCGKVRFEADADLSTVYACNCSICARMGWRLAFVKDGEFRLLQGKEALTDYQFGKHHIHHVFCSTCGVRTFSHGEDKQGTPTYSINVRCLEGVGADADTLPVERFDGASL